MKTDLSNPGRAILRARRLAAGCSLWLATLGAGATEEPKSHTLFLGAEFALEQDGQLLPVVDVAGEAFVVRSEGKERKVPMSRSGAKLRVTPTLKLTETSATLADFSHERAYTAARDPNIALQRRLNSAARQFAESQASMNQANADVKMLDATTAAASAAMAKDGYASGVVQQVQQSGVQRSMNLSTASAASAPGTNMLGNRGESITEGGFDAMAISFELSAPRALTRPYVVCVAQYREPGAKPNQTANWIYARALQPIDRTPKKLHFEQGGFPPGYEVVDFQVHLYDQGEEIATNVSAKRVALTRADAHLYVVTEYVGSHKGATLAAVPAMGRLPEDFPTRLANGSLKDVVYVKVDSGGKPLAAYRDQSCAQRVEDPYVSGLVAGILFKPALASGKPVEGVAAVDFAKLVL